MLAIGYHNITPPQNKSTMPQQGPLVANLSDSVGIVLEVRESNQFN